MTQAGLAKVDAPNTESSRRLALSGGPYRVIGGHGHVDAPSGNLPWERNRPPPGRKARLPPSRQAWEVDKARCKIKVSCIKRLGTSHTCV